MGFLAFGTLWFWFALVAIFGTIIYFLESALYSEHDDGGGFKSTVTIIGFLVLYYFCGSSEDILSIFNYIKSNTVGLLAWIGVYAALGLVWSFVKWYFFLLNKKDKQLEQLQKDVKYYNRFTESKLELPTAGENKMRIISWMTYWPFSIVWTLINEPVKRFFNFIYTRFTSIYDKVHAVIEAKLNADNAKLLEKRKAKESVTVNK